MNNLSQAALKSAAEMVQGLYGDLSDLPRELANTICNIYITCHLSCFPTAPTKNYWDPTLGPQRALMWIWNNCWPCESDPRSTFIA
ncbi:hypothetical protein QFZ91_000204 [Paraburkholderia sp. JPY419]